MDTSTRQQSKLVSTVAKSTRGKSNHLSVEGDHNVADQKCCVKIILPQLILQSLFDANFSNKNSAKVGAFPRNVLTMSADSAPK